MITDKVVRSLTINSPRDTLSTYSYKTEQFHHTAHTDFILPVHKIIGCIESDIYSYCIESYHIHIHNTSNSNYTLEVHDGSQYTIDPHNAESIYTIYINDDLNQSQRDSFIKIKPQQAGHITFYCVANGWTFSKDESILSNNVDMCEKEYTSIDSMHNSSKHEFKWDEHYLDMTYSEHTLSLPSGIYSGIAIDSDRVSYNISIQSRVYNSNENGIILLREVLNENEKCTVTLFYPTDFNQKGRLRIILFYSCMSLLSSFHSSRYHIDPSVKVNDQMHFNVNQMRNTELLQDLHATSISIHPFCFRYKSVLQCQTIFKTLGPNETHIITDEYILHCLSYEVSKHDNGYDEALDSDYAIYVNDELFSSHKPFVQKVLTSLRIESKSQFTLVFYMTLFKSGIYI